MSQNEGGLSRRKVLHAAAATALAAPALILGRTAWSQTRKLTFAWNQSAFCLTPIVLAQEREIVREVERRGSEQATPRDDALAALSGDGDVA